MTKILNYLWRFWLIILAFVLTIILGLPVYLLSLKKSTFKYAHIFIRIWCYGMFFGMGLRYQLINLTDKKIDKNTQYVIISNHTSIMDIMLPCILFPNHQLCYVGKKELEKIPIFGTIYKRICVMVDRGSARSRADVYRRCAEKMEEGNSIVLFPEGGVPDDTSVVLDEFKDGAFTLSSKHHSPIAVFTFVGLKEIFPFDNSKGHPGKVKIFFNDILEPTDSPKNLKLTAFETIKKTLTEHS
ncbi:1-acyl-sn-glycerol-3-phosphate acyltransferase [Chryseobacterium sp. Ch-15]|uniref:1-acyl-sn-glycerol-3-phosphate acyltransferase n=1 Tax=Chryseobacterium muglaense TaxID=2893752 RepID=A0A9Q3UYT4_9FLAO|nr:MULTISPECIES: lysophospholipid acyltransferase family protein [Chryseobacterium]MBD3905811.1 1-acyl-sn-glycerol-3-phosphate acyltransferase [Chryseobacterium muglaense]MBO6184278.1 1-acyl-sn-glycerol-3-phosphate acyltransferase [Chryseobacterium sp.]MCC9035804.1 1-acyl-sn-glycerol-3-phosphate acyltransferase [Chryseobacterium muglaense]MCM2555514.1 1-acyl-sn-glycerol-3-phosphate acyltransferase [Chryseobacterium muglaense]